MLEIHTAGIIELMSACGSTFIQAFCLRVTTLATVMVEAMGFFHMVIHPFVMTFTEPPIGLRMAGVMVEVTAILYIDHLTVSDMEQVMVMDAAL